jgi:hypothetical protein
MKTIPTTSTIVSGDFEAKIDNDGLIISDYCRQGNKIIEISMDAIDFISLYNLVATIAALHPEWLQ